jgi:uncharacterized membrane protein YkoI
MRLLSTLTLAAALACAAGSLSAQDAQAPTRDVPDSLVARAKVSEDSARAIALKRVPGTVQGTELSRERGRLLYEFKIQRSGRKGTTEVEVNAMTGKVVAVQTARAKARSTTRHSS